jgi:DNA-binding CsgD family transcriptional regulator
MHLQSAQAAASSFAGAMVANTVAAGQSATLLLDQTMEIVSADAAGRSLLDAQNGIRLSLGKLSTGAASVDSQIRGAIVAGSAISGLRVGRMLISVFPISALQGDGRQAVVIVQPAAADVDDNIDAVRRDCALTGAETETLRLVYKGLNTIEAANVLGLAKSTVRTHLQKVFAKTDTSRQSELVHFVATYQLN